MVSPGLSQLATDVFQPDNILQHVQHFDSLQSSTTVEEVVESSTHVDVSSHVAATVSLYSDIDVTSSSLLRQFSASTANGLGPLAVKSGNSSSVAAFASKYDCWATFV